MLLDCFPPVMCVAWKKGDGGDVGVKLKTMMNKSAVDVLVAKS